GGRRRDRRRRRRHLGDGARGAERGGGQDREEAGHGVFGGGCGYRRKLRAPETCSSPCPTLARTAWVACRLASAKREKARCTPSRADAISASVGCGAASVAVPVAASARSLRGAAAGVASGGALRGR